MKKQDEKKQDGLPAQDELQKNEAPCIAETPVQETEPEAVETAAAEAVSEAEVTPANPEESAAKTGKTKKKKTKKAKKSGKRRGKKIAIITVASLLAIIILVIGIILGVGSCNKSGLITQPDINTTLRKEAPTDGTTPEDHIALDNIAYMAYVLDHQPFYHAYANNSTKSTGYEQITQTWKDYKIQEVDGQSRKVMVCSDISYSLFVKSATQTCFVDNKVAYMRNGSRPDKNSVATDLVWSAEQPVKYTKEDYLKTYGEFSTELSVYVINESTVESAGEVVNNGDGTYSQTYTLNAGAAYWYQYGMKTRGGLKDYPSFEKIEITFTFDGKWQVLSTYCEEKAKIAPGALGGFPMDSSSKTTTTFDYSETNFDAAHYGYFDSYYSAYLDKELNSGGNDSGEEVVLTDVLMGGFGKVISESGQQFALGLNLGESVYDGKIYLKLTDLSDVLNTLDVRLSLGKRGSGNQDLYAEFNKGKINLYYSDSFALTADIDKVSASVKAVSDWINGILGNGSAGEEAGEPAPQSDGGFDISSLLSALKVEPEKLTPEDTEVKISLVTDDLLGLGIGVNLEMNFDRSVSDDGLNLYAFNNLKLDGLAYDSAALALRGAIVPDETEIIKRNPAESVADLADYIDAVLALANSKSYIIDLSLDGTCESISYINGLKAEASVQVELAADYKSIKVYAPLTVEYKNLSAELTAYYTVNLENGGYGEVYLSLNKINGKDYSAQVCCDIGELVSSVNKLISMFTATEAETASEQSEPVPDEQTKTTVAEIINTILNLDFGAIVTELKANENEIKVSVNADEILKTVLTVLNKQFDIELGTATLSVKLSGGKASLGGLVSKLGLSLGINGSEDGVADIDKDAYADIVSYLNGIYALLNSKTYAVGINLDGSCNSIEYLKNVTASATAYAKLSKDFKNIEVYVPALTVNYQGLTATLGLYYTVNLSDGGYGKVFVDLTEIGGKTVSAKVYCDIEDTVNAVTSLINSFKGTPASEEAPAAVYANVVDTVLSLDFAAIITELKAGAEEIKLGVDADEILKALDIDLGIKFGSVVLNLGLTEGKATLTGAVPSFGLNLAVNGSDSEIPAFDEKGYADATAYVNGVSALLSSNTLAISLKLDGTCNSIEYIKDIEATANALVKFSKDFKNIEVYVPALTVTYKGLTLVLDVNYSVNTANGGYGTVYLHVTEIGGKAVSAKVYCNISETVDAVTQIVGMFKKEEAPAPAATYAEDSGNKVAEIIGQIVAIDFKAIINTLTADNTGINAAVNADEILKLLNININGVKLGTASVTVKLGTDNQLSVSGGLKDLGLTLGVSGSGKTIPAVKTAEYADLTSYVNGVYNLLNSTTYSVTLNLDGSKCTALNNIADETVKKAAAYLKDVTASTTAQVKISPDFKTVTVSAPLTVTYKKFNVGLDIYYTLNIGSGYGKAFVTLNNIKEQSFSARVGCDVSEVVTAVKELINLFSANNGTQTQSEQEAEEGAEAVSDIVGKLVSLDFKKIISLLTADNTGVNLTVSADEILKAFNVDLKGVSLGEVALSLGIDSNKCASLTGSVPALGLTTLSLNGSSKDIVGVDESKYLNLADILYLVKSGAAEVKDIMDTGAVIFDVDRISVTVDGVKMSIAGSGEASWKNKTTRVALDLALTIAEGEASETVYVKFVYDEAETAEHLIRFTINELGLVIDRSDIDGIKGGIDEIINVLSPLIGDKTQAPAAATYAADGEGSGEEAPDNITTVINAVLKFASNLKIELTEAENAGEGAVKSLVISYAENGVLTVGANGGLGLSLLVKNDNGTEIADIAASVHAPAAGEDKFAEINGKFDDGENGYKFYKSGEEQLFTKAVYDYLFEVLKDLTVKELLESKTYTVTVALDGDASGIEQLKGISVNAELYYTEVAVVTASEDGAEVTEYKKLVEIEISELNIKGTIVKASASYFDGYFYITLSQVGDTSIYSSFTDAENNAPLMIKASRTEIYNAVDTLVKIITNKNAPAIIALIKGDASAAAALAENEEPAAPYASGTEATLNKILNAIFALAIDFEKADGENTLTLNIDGLLAQFNLGVSLGDIKVAVNPETHSVSATVTKGEKTWAALNAFADESVNHGKAPEGNYIDIDFVATLLEDINVTLNSLGTRTETVDGKEITKPDIRVSLTGELKVDVSYSVISTNVTIKDVVLTVGLNEEDKFYFALQGNLQESNAKVSVLPLPVTVAKPMPVSVTYSDGYITMGRTNDKGEKIYKVMTLEYLIDNMLDKNSSPVRWWLGTNETVWGLICDNVKLPLNSGLTDKQEYYLYEHETQTQVTDPDEAEAKMFNLASLLLGLDAKLGEYNSLFGSEVAKFSGVTDNYYSVLIDLSSLLGNSFTPLRAALVRNADGGLKGLDAYVALKDGGNEVLKVNVGLDAGIITAETEDKKHAPDYYKLVNADNKVIDFNHFGKDENKIFGCYNTEDGSYDYSEYNKSYTLNVYVFEGDDYDNYPANVMGNVLHGKHRNVSLKSGSTVYMLPEEMWLDEDHTRKLIYVDGNGNDLGLTFTMRADINIYTMIVGEDTVSFFDSFGNKCPVIGSEDNTLSLYVGNALPMPQSLTAEKNGVSYTFAGWYKEEGLENHVDSVQAGVNAYYAKYLTTYVTLSNGVTYMFTYDNETEAGGYYTAYSFDNAKADKDYTLPENTLIIADSIGGYPVTTIGKSAFKAKSIKNVVVPENVTRIEAQAFMDNKGMLSAVFLADTVWFGGTDWTGDYRFVFYGCGKSSSNETQTNLQIYYNYATSENNNTDWMGFCRTGTVMYKYYYIADNGGSRNGSRINHENKLVYEGSPWAYLTYKVEGAGFTPAELGLKNYLTTSDSYDGLTVRDILPVVNELTLARYGFTDGYEVSVNGEYSLPYGRIILTAELNRVEEETFYAFAFNRNSETCTADYAVAAEDTRDIGDGKIYIRYGATVTLTAAAAGTYKFDGWNVNGATVTENSIVINGVTSVTAMWSANYAKNVYVSSEVDFTYGGTPYSKDNVRLENAAIGETLEAPAATGYRFLGWATADGEQLTVHNSITVSDIEVTYFALWVSARGDVSFDFDKASNKLTASVKDGFDGSVYGWYKGTDTNFTGSELAKNTDNSFTFTASNTSVCVRLQYTLNLYVYASHKAYGSKVEVFTGDGEDNTASDSKGATKNQTSIASLDKNYVIYEKETIFLQDSDVLSGYDAGKVFKIWKVKADGTELIAGEIRIKSGSTNWVSSYVTVNPTITLNDEVCTVTDKVNEDGTSYTNYYIVNSNMNFKFTSTD